VGIFSGDLGGSGLFARRFVAPGRMGERWSGMTTEEVFGEDPRGLGDLLQKNQNVFSEHFNFHLNINVNAWKI